METPKTQTKFLSYAQLTRDVDWGKSVPITDKEQLTDAQILMGCHLRIATATEKMANNIINLMDSRDRYKKLYEELAEKENRYRQRISFLERKVKLLQNQLEVSHG